MTKTELLNKLTEELAGSNERTTKQFASIISQFYTSSGGIFTRRAVVNYITKMAQKGYAPGTNRLHFRVLKRAFEIAAKIDPTIEWPFSKRAPAEIDTALADIPWQENKIAFSSDDVKQLIDAVKEGKLSGVGEGKLGGVANALVALSTTYGLRRIEMADLDSDSLNLKTKRLRVLTKHGSRLREHIIPDEIIPYLKDYRPLRSEFKLSEVFHDIERASGVPERYGTGWHSIRRSVVNALVNTGLDKLYIYSYMRWKLSMSFGMLGTYFSVPDLEVDEAVQKLLPYLKFWES